VGASLLVITGLDPVISRGTVLVQITGSSPVMTIGGQTGGSDIPRLCEKPNESLAKPAEWDSAG
jgi:hypothetical protein